MEIGASFSLQNMLPGDIDYIIFPKNKQDIQLRGTIKRGERLDVFKFDLVKDSIQFLFNINGYQKVVKAREIMSHSPKELIHHLRPTKT